MNLRDRWSSWWTGSLAEARDDNPELTAELDRMRDVIVRALQVIDLHRARCAHLTVERDRAVRDLHDVLGLRSSNEVMPMFEKENE